MKASVEAICYKVRSLKNGEYMELLKMLNTAKGLADKHILQQALECVDYSRFVTKKGEKDYFMYDNAFRDEYVKSLYIHPHKIKNSFANSGKFDVTYRYIQSRTFRHRP